MIQKQPIKSDPFAGQGVQGLPDFFRSHPRRYLYPQSLSLPDWAQHCRSLLLIRHLYACVHLCCSDRPELLQLAVRARFKAEDAFGRFTRISWFFGIHAAFCNDVLVGAIAVRLERQPGGRVQLYIITLGVLAAYRNYGVGESTQDCHSRRLLASATRISLALLQDAPGAGAGAATGWRLILQRRPAHVHQALEPVISCTSQASGRCVCELPATSADACFCRDATA